MLKDEQPWSQRAPYPHAIAHPAPQSFSGPLQLLCKGWARTDSRWRIREQPSHSAGCGDQLSTARAVVKQQEWRESAGSREEILLQLWRGRRARDLAGGSPGQLTFSWHLHCFSLGAVTTQVLSQQNLGTSQDPSARRWNLFVHI